MTDPAERYADRVDPAHRDAMEMVRQAYLTLQVAAPQLREVKAAERRMHNFGHIIDPTLYRDMIYSRQFEFQMKVINAALEFVAKMDAIRLEDP